MKRIIAVVLLAALLCAGCAKVGKCESCGQKEKLNSFEHKGEKYWLCDDCYRLYKFNSSLF